MPFDVSPAVYVAKLELQDLADTAGMDEEIMDSNIANKLLKNTTLEKFLSLSKELLKATCEKILPHVKLNITGIKNGNAATREASSQTKKRVALELIEVLDQRYADFDASIFKDMQWMNILLWLDEINFGDDQVIALYMHFDVPLNQKGFNIDFKGVEIM